jgi:hypothetical protein
MEVQQSWIFILRFTMIFQCFNQKLKKKSKCDIVAKPQSKIKPLQWWLICLVWIFQRVIYPVLLMEGVVVCGRGEWWWWSRLFPNEYTYMLMNVVGMDMHRWIFTIWFGPSRWPCGRAIFLDWMIALEISYWATPKEYVKKRYVVIDSLLVTYFALLLHPSPITIVKVQQPERHGYPWSPRTRGSQPSLTSGPDLPDDLPTYMWAQKTLSAPWRPPQDLACKISHYRLRDGAHQSRYHRILFVIRRDSFTCCNRPGLWFHRSCSLVYQTI